MKILFLSSSLAPHFGGAAVSESALSAELSKEHNVLVLSRQDRLDKEFVERQGIKSTLPFKPISVLFAFLKPGHPLNREIRSSDVFHLNGHWFWENYFFARLCYRYGVPYILHPRGMLWVAYRRPYLKKLFNLILGNWIVSHASKVILLSEFERNHCEGYPVKEDNLTVFPNGIRCVEGGGDSLSTGSYFLYLGRIEPRKNLEFLIRVFSQIYKKNSSVQLRLVGPVERNYDSLLKRLVSKYKLEEVIKIQSAVYNQEKIDLLRNASAVIYPAKGEPFGRTIFEAFAAGTLCLIPTNSGGVEYVEKFAPFVIYEEKSEDSLATKMQEVLALTYSERNQHIKNSQNWVSTHLDWTAITQKIVKIYHQILD